MISFFFAVLLLLSTPGPGVLSTAGFGSAYGFRPGLLFVLGLFIGSNIVLLSVVSGIAAMAFSIAYVREAILICSVLYLLYLAARIALAGSEIAFIKAQKQPGVWSGVGLQILNPKAYVVGATLFSGFNFLPDNTSLEIFAKFLVLNLVWIPVHFTWLFAGVSLKRLNLPAKTQRTINMLMAVAMLGVILLASYSA